MADNSQNNILITQDGQACLTDFGITGAFGRFFVDDYETETIRYMAPECVSMVGVHLGSGNGPSKLSDIYSLAVVSFSVCSSIVNYPAT